MKLRTIRVENFRSFQDETIHFNSYSCFVGPNGAGKSNILCALNVFFREQASSATDVTQLTDEDYFGKNTNSPVRITITFNDLSPAAQAELSAYVRQNELVVTAEAMFDVNKGVGQVKHYGQRSGMVEFRPFFEAEKAGAKVGEITPVFEALRQQFLIFRIRARRMTKWLPLGPMRRNFLSDVPLYRAHKKGSGVFV